MSSEKINKYRLWREGANAAMAEHPDGEYYRVKDVQHLLDRPSPWRPIAEAPKDGTRILVLTKYGIIEGSYDKDYDCFSIYVGSDIHFCGTHFMPLPEPPKEGGGV